MYAGHGTNLCGFHRRTGFEMWGVVVSHTSYCHLQMLRFISIESRGSDYDLNNGFVASIRSRRTTS